MERKKLAESERTLEGLRSELRATLAERDRIEREKAAIAGRLVTVERQRQTLETEKADAERRIAGLDKEKADLLARIVGLDRLRSQERLVAEKEKEKLTTEKASLEQIVAALEKRLAALETARKSAEESADKLTADKSTLEQRLLALEARRQTEEDARRQLATERQTLAQRLTTLERELTTLRTENEALLRERERLQAALSTENKTAGDRKQLTERQAAEIALLNRQMAELRKQLAAIETALRVSESKGEAQKTEIADLGRRLNAALATQVQELQRYRSEFFGRLRQVLGSRADIRVVGDRFVFQSEVLFPVGSDEINPAGRDQLAKLARSLKEIAAKIPKDLNWVLRVDGHTDKRPIRSDRFPSNWELSSARAIAVVRFLISEGVPAHRLVAAGFGEYQPLEEGSSEDAYNRNRRIELKLTER
ncbi:MAG: peptidoglycan -binding protein [Rhodospirillaceae bacterium]|nr:peptidoglycan -binding protein [Rhodospirillaceae bacterium]